MVVMTGARLLLLGAMMSLTGCTLTGSSLSADKIDYQAVKTRTTPLEVPPDLSQLPRDERFQVPDRPQSVTASGGGAVRPGAGSASGGPAVAPAGVVAKIDRQGNQRWLAVNMPPEKAWPILLGFWPSIGLTVEKSDPAAGVMETTWSENRAKLPQDIIRSTLGKVLDSVYSTGEQDKFRARIERTAEGTSEIFVSHRGMIEVHTSTAQDRTMWQPRPNDSELEAEILQRLMARFDAGTARPATVAAASASAPATSAAAATTAPAKARLVKGADGRTERVEVNEAFDRAWRQIGLALDRGGFTVEDRDRAKGLYFVRYLDPEYETKARDEQGFLTKLFGRDKPIAAPQYRVLVEQQGATSTAVLVFDKDGKPERSPVGDRILALLSDQLR